MSLRLSTGLRDKMLGLQATVGGAIVGATLTFVDGGGSDDTITDSGSGFLTAGFTPGDVVFVQNSPNNDGMSGAICKGVAAGTLTFDTGVVQAGEAADADTVLAWASGGSLKDIFKDGVLRIYSGSQRSTADDAVSGTLLLEISVDAGTFAHGAFANGLEFGAAASGAISKCAAETWQGTGLAAGTAGWFRLCANPTDDGSSSTTLSRIDGTVGTSGADLNMTNTTITAGATYTIDAFTLTLPYQYGT